MSFHVKELKVRSNRYPVANASIRGQVVVPVSGFAGNAVDHRQSVVNFLLARDCTMKRHHTHSVCEPWATSIDQCATRPTRFCHLHYRDGQFLLDDHLPPESLQTSVNLGTNTDRDRHTAAGDRQVGTGPLPSLRTVVCLIFLSGYGVGPPPQIVVDSQQHEPPSIQVALATGYCAGWKATRLVSIFHSATSCDESGGCRSHAPAAPGSGIPTSGISVCFTSLEARARSESSCWPGPASQWRTPPESGCV